MTWEIFRKDNQVDEKAVVGYLSFVVMCLFALADIATGIFGIELAISNFVFGSFVTLTLGSFGISGAEKLVQK